MFEKKKLSQALKLLKMLYLNRDTKYPNEVSGFENRYAKFIGTDYALSFCNGTTAFDSALFSLGLRDGDSIILCGMNFQSVVLTSLQSRLRLKYVDMDENLNTRLDDTYVDENTKLIIISHLFGNPQNMDEVTKFVKKHNLLLLEDCSHAHGAEFNGSKVGNFGDVSFFSLQGEKAISGGEAGVAITNNKECYDRMRLYAHMGRDMSDIEVDALFRGR